jgi:glycerophosphoryl diester phosphodiesterase
VTGWLLALGLVALAAAVGGAAASPERHPLVAAHRGGALLWPENSLLAFRQALALGVDVVECDVHLTADDDVVVIHDPTLDRTTTGRGPVREARLADLAAVRLRGPDGQPTDERVPTLAQLLQLLAPARAGLLLEIKTGPGRQRYPGIEEKVLALVRAAGLADRTLVMAFEPDTLRRLRELDRSARTVLLVSRRMLETAGAAAADAVRWTREHGGTHLGMDFRALDGRVIEAARSAGVVVAAWTVNDEADLRRIMGLGVDLVISDRPDLALELRGGR